MTPIEENVDRFLQLKDEVKNATDIADLAREVLPLREGRPPLLRQRGRTSLITFCPFHEESTPSFTIFTDTQHWKCFGACCSALAGKTSFDGIPLPPVDGNAILHGGDIFTLLMALRGWNFRMSFEWLAERAGISLQGLFDTGKEEHQ